MIAYRRRAIALTLLLGVLQCNAQDQAFRWTAAEILTASNADADDQLGLGGALMGSTLALSRDGRTLAVASTQEDSAIPGINGDQTDNSSYATGAVYVFTLTGSTWSQQAILKASNPALGDGFGFAVALSGDGNTLAVAANFEDSGAVGINGNQADDSADEAGAVYVFVRDSGTWSQQAYIKPAIIDTADRFGFSLALSDDGATLAVGAIGEDGASTAINGDASDNSATDAGAVYVFTRNGSSWAQQAYLKASNAQAGDLYGFCVALSADGDTLGVCAYDEDSAAEGINGDQSDNRATGSGAAFVLERSGGRWRQQAYIKASNTTTQAAFGTSIALSGDGRTLAVCAGDEDGIETGVGAAQWQENFPPLERTRAAEGSAGAVYVYRRPETQWNFDTYIKSSNMRGNDTFGSRLALNTDGTVLAASAPQQPGGESGINSPPVDHLAPESGAVFLFSRDSQRWRQDAYVKVANPADYDSFGSALAISGDGRLVAAAAPGADGPTDATRDAGAVYLFERLQSQ